MTSSTVKGLYIKAYLAIMVAVLVWSGQKSVLRLMMTTDGTYDALQMTFLRTVISTAIIIPFMGYSLWCNRRALWHNRWFMMKTSLFGMLGYATFANFALAHTTALNVTIIIALTPAMNAIVGRLFFSQPLEWVTLPYIILSLLGVGVIVSRGDVFTLMNLDFNIGDLSMVGCVISWAVYTLYMRDIPDNLGSFHLVAGNIILAVFTSGVLVLLFSNGPIIRDIWTVEYTAQMLYMAVLTAIVATALYTKAVATVGTVNTTILLNLVPVFGGLIAIVALGETFQAYHAVGSIMIGFSVYKIIQRPIKNNPLLKA